MTQEQTTNTNIMKAEVKSIKINKRTTDIIISLENRDGNEAHNVRDLLLLAILAGGNSNSLKQVFSGVSANDEFDLLRHGFLCLMFDAQENTEVGKLKITDKHTFY